LLRTATANVQVKRYDHTLLHVIPKEPQSPLYRFRVDPERPDIRTLPSEADYDAAIEQVGKPQDLRFETLKEAEEHAEQLLKSPEFADVGRAYSYAWRHKSPKMKAVAEKAIQILTSVRGYHDYVLKKRAYDPKALIQTARKLNTVLPKTNMPITPLGPSVNSKSDPSNSNENTTSNHDSFEQGQWVYVPSFGIAKITAFKNKGDTTSKQTFTIVQNPMEFVNGITKKNKGVAAGSRSRIAEHIPFSTASGKDVFEEIIKEAHTPQNKKFDNIDQLLEHVGALMNSTDPVDVGRAWAYMSGRMKDERVNKFAKRAIEIFLSHRMYVDVIQTGKLPSPPNLTQASGQNNAILPTKIVTPLIGETVTPPTLPTNIWEIAPVTAKSASAKPKRKKPQKPKRVKKPKKKKGGQPDPAQKLGEDNTPAPEEEIQETEEATVVIEETPEAVTVETATIDIVEEVEPEVIEAVKEPEEPIAEKPEEAEQPQEKPTAEPVAEPVRFEKPADMTTEEYEETVLNDYFNAIAENVNDAEHNELYYLQLMFATKEMNALSFKQKYLVLHELYGQAERGDVISTINSVHKSRKPISAGNYKSNVRAAFNEFVNIAERDLTMIYDSQETKDLLNADGTEERVYNRIGERHFSLK